MDYRIEKDTMGEVKVPVDAYYGAQTQRSIDNFRIAQDINRMPREIIRAFAFLKKAAAITNMEAGVLPAEKCELIGLVCDEILEGKMADAFPLVVWQTGSGTQSNMNVNEVVAYRGHVIKGGSLTDKDKFLHPNDDVNKSQSSNDTFPTAMHIAAYEILLKTTLPGIEKLRNTLAEKSRAFMKVVKIGRTHFMDATPLTLGQEFSGYVSQLDHGIRAIRNTLDHLSELALGGTAVGTGINTPDGYADNVALHIANLTGLPFVSAENKFEALAAHDAIVEAHGALKTVAVSLMKIANDIRWLASGPRCGLGELILPENEPGSSIMPGKVNPTQCEMDTMVAVQVLANNTAVQIASSQGNFELNVFKPLIALNVLNSLELLRGACTGLRQHCVEDLQADESRIAHHLEQSLMLVTALTPLLGYDKACAIARHAHDHRLSLRESAVALGGISAEEFDRCVNPRQMI